MRPPTASLSRVCSPIWMARICGPRHCEVVMRYLSLTPDDRRAMLARIGAPDLDALFRDVPKAALAPLTAFDLPDTQGEMEVERTLSKLASRNVAAGAAPFFC